MFYRDSDITMEDWKTFICTTSYLAFHKAGLDPWIMKAFGHLRAGIKFFLEYCPGQHQEQHIENAQNEMCQYAVMVEAAFGQHELMTHQLHQCVVHLAEQARMCGPVAFATEGWVERMCGFVKEFTKYRCTRYPELTAVSFMLFGQALSNCLLTIPNISKTFDDATTRQKSRKAQLKRERKEQLKDNLDNPDFIVGVMEDISEDRIAV